MNGSEGDEALVENLKDILANLGELRLDLLPLALDHGGEALRIGVAGCNGVVESRAGGIHGKRVGGYEAFRGNA
jgi:hypothetical protein